MKLSLRTRRPAPGRRRRETVGLRHRRSVPPATTPGPEPAAAARPAQGRGPPGHSSRRWLHDADDPADRGQRLAESTDDWGEPVGVGRRRKPPHRLFERLVHPQLALLPVDQQPWRAPESLLIGVQIQDPAASVTAAVRTPGGPGRWSCSVKAIRARTKHGRNWPPRPGPRRRQDCPWTAGTSLDTRGGLSTRTYLQVATNLKRLA